MCEEECFEWRHGQIGRRLDHHGRHVLGEVDDTGDCVALGADICDPGVIAEIVGLDAQGAGAELLGIVDDISECGDRELDAAVEFTEVGLDSVGDEVGLHQAGEADGHERAIVAAVELRCPRARGE